MNWLEKTSIFCKCNKGPSNLVVSDIKMTLNFFIIATSTKK